MWVRAAGTHCASGGKCVECTTDSHCSTGKTCSQNKCLLASGQSCTVGSSCASGTCTTYYIDGDVDGYGSPDNPIGRCSGAAIPNGYVTRSGDCCDRDGNAKPSQTDFFDVLNACNSWDYNCDGKSDPMPNQLGPSNCGDVTISCALSPAGDMCMPTCTSTNPACNGACSVNTQPSCGMPIQVSAHSCSSPTGTGHGDLFCVTLDNGGPLANQKCH